VSKFFSIITVTLNAENDLKETIDSLKKQEFKDFEYIIIDGKSSDNTDKLIKINNHIIDKYLIEKDHGIYDAMNKGLNLATGKYIGFLNAGDKYTPDGLKIINEYLNSNDVDFIFGTVKKKILKYGFRKKRIFYNFDFYTSHSSGFFIKKKSHDLIGNYNTKYKISADYDLFYKMIVKKKMKGISTKKNELIGLFKSGSSYSSKFNFLEHLYEETQIRIDNNQNKFIVFLIFNIHFFKNLKKIKTKKKVSSFINGIKIIFC